MATFRAKRRGSRTGKAGGKSSPAKTAVLHGRRSGTRHHSGDLDRKRRTVFHLSRCGPHANEPSVRISPLVASGTHVEVWIPGPQDQDADRAVRPAQDSWAEKSWHYSRCTWILGQHLLTRSWNEIIASLGGSNVERATPLANRCHLSCRQRPLSLG